MKNVYEGWVEVDEEGCPTDELGEDTAEDGYGFFTLAFGPINMNKKALSGNVKKFKVTLEIED